MRLNIKQVLFRFNSSVSGISVRIVYNETKKVKLTKRGPYNVNNIEKKMMMVMTTTTTTMMMMMMTTTIKSYAASIANIFKRTNFIDRTTISISFGAFSRTRHNAYETSNSWRFHPPFAY